MARKKKVEEETVNETLDLAPDESGETVLPPPTLEEDNAVEEPIDSGVSAIETEEADVEGIPAIGTLSEEEAPGTQAQTIDTEPKPIPWAARVDFPFTVRVPVELASIAGRFVRIENADMQVDPQIISWMKADLNHRWKFDDTSKHTIADRRLSGKRND